MANGGQALSFAGVAIQKSFDCNESEENAIQAGAEVLKGYSLEPHEYDYALSELRKIAGLIYNS